jgi:pimeloyl-ACP methyl ester carboxylesterase
MALKNIASTKLSKAMSPARSDDGRVADGDPQSTTFPTETAVQLSVLAYEKNIETLKEELSDLAAVTPLVFEDRPQSWQRSAFGFACIIDGHAWLVFRGSNQWADWKQNARFLSRSGVHRGFLDEWHKLEANVRQWLADNRDAYTAINLTGHSLGGAIALLGAYHLFDDYPAQVSRIITFGSPAPFYSDAAGRYEQMKLPAQTYSESLEYRTLRVVNKQDVVTWLPSLVGLKHVGQVERIGPKTMLGGVWTRAKYRYDKLRGFVPAPMPHSINKDEAQYAFEKRKWFDAEAKRQQRQQFWLNGGGKALGQILLPFLSSVTAAAWFVIYAISAAVVVIAGVFHLVESGLSHLRKNYVDEIVPREPEARFPWQQ